MVQILLQKHYILSCKVAFTISPNISASFLRIFVIISYMNDILFGALKRYKWSVFFYLILGISGYFMGSLSSVYFQKIIDQIPHLSSFSGIYSIFLTYLLLRVGMHLMPYLVEYPYRILFEGIYQWAKLVAMKKIASIDYRAYQNLGTGKLTQVIENGAESTRKITLDFYLCIIREIIPTILINLFFIRYYDKNIFLVILVGYIFIFAFSYWLLRFLKEKKEKILVHGLR